MAVLSAEEPMTSSSDEEGDCCYSPASNNYGINGEINREEKINSSLDHEIKKIDDEISEFNDDYEGYGGMINREIKAGTCSTTTEADRSRASNLSYEALQLLRHASRSLMKKKKQRRRKRSIITACKLAIEAADRELFIEAHDEGDDPYNGDMVQVNSATTGIRSARENAMRATGKIPMGVEGAAVGKIAMEAAAAAGDRGAGAVEGTMEAADASTCTIIKLKDDRVMLYKELQSLRSMIPSHILQAGDLDAQPCVVRNALSYLKFLKQEMKSLKEGLTNPLESKIRTCFDAQVDVRMSTMERLEVKVSCKKRVGLLAELMVAFESQGLHFDSFDASCHQWLLLRASSTQKGICYMDIQAIRRAILLTIYRK